MSQLGIWSITENGPQRAPKTRISLEKHLEDWIERDPNLLWSGLTIVGRQVTLGGLRLDLIAITPEDRWAVIELKAGHLYRETLMQALDYASVIGNLPADDLESRLNRVRDEETRTRVRAMLEAEEDESVRDLIVVIAGTTIDPGLKRMVQFLENFDLPIRIVSYDVYGDAVRGQFLVREVTESSEQRLKSGASGYSVDRIRQVAIDSGSVTIFDEFIEFARDQGLYIRPWKKAITINPPFNRSLTLIYVRPHRDNGLYLGHSEENWTSQYPIADEDVAETIGRWGNWRDYNEQGVRDYLAGFDALLKRALPDAT